MLNLKFHYLSGWEWVVLGGCGVGWSEIEIKANSAKLKLELGLSLAIQMGQVIFNQCVMYWNSSAFLYVYISLY